MEETLVWLAVICKAYFSLERAIMRIWERTFTRLISARKILDAQKSSPRMSTNWCKINLVAFSSVALLSIFGDETRNYYKKILEWENGNRQLPCYKNTTKATLYKPWDFEHGWDTHSSEYKYLKSISINFLLTATIEIYLVRSEINKI